MKKTMFYDAPPLIFERAKYLRNHMTHAETVLWEYLKTRPMGHKFRRQHPIDLYIVDFYCHSLKLVIEADGNIHDLIEVQQADNERQRSLEADGLFILRFTNDKILKSLELIKSKIKNTILEIEHPVSIESKRLLLTDILIPPSGG